ncbi:MAG: hypothetical protein FWG18_02630 [Alphaproteobacteria bacterium]|nr:hypothetical protein [Alphaproteobacteria bacterium]
MKKFLLIACLGASLTACGGTMKALRPGSTPDKENAVLVARVELSPAINKSWEEAREKDKKFMTFNMAITKGDGTNIQEKGDIIDMEFGDLETNQFFAIEVKPGQQLAISGLAFSTSHKAFWLSNTEHFYDTQLLNPTYAIENKLTAGNAYYIGTIKIALAEKSFRETGDEEYDREELQFVIPKDIKIADETTAAKKWFEENHAKVGGNLGRAGLTMKDSGRKNNFNHTAVTTTYR